MTESSQVTCAACGNACPNPYIDPEALHEATLTFRPEELEDAVVICDDCWGPMRAAQPDLDARYREQGL